MNINNLHPIKHPIRLTAIKVVGPDSSKQPEQVVEAAGGTIEENIAIALRKLKEALILNKTSSTASLNECKAAFEIPESMLKKNGHTEGYENDLAKGVLTIKPSPAFPGKKLLKISIYPSSSFVSSQSTKNTITHMQSVGYTACEEKFLTDLDNESHFIAYILEKIKAVDGQMTQKTMNWQ